MDEIAAVTPIYAGVSHARLNAGAQLHWPVRISITTGRPSCTSAPSPAAKGSFILPNTSTPRNCPTPSILSC